MRSTLTTGLNFCDHLLLPATLNIAAPCPVTMRTLAEAAQMPLDLHPAQGEGAHQHVTLDCSALTALHQFEPGDMEPAEMIRQWRALESARVS